MEKSARRFGVPLSIGTRLVRLVASALIPASILLTAGLDSSLAAGSDIQHSTGTYRAPEKTFSLHSLSFSSNPTDEELVRNGLFAEPLAAVATATEDDNRDLAQALLAYRDAVEKSGANDAVEPLLGFLSAHPKSKWTPALELNLGIIYRQTGHFSKALEIWQAGWRDTQTMTDARGRALANAMVARLSQLEAYLGRKELLQPLLDSIHTRPIGGTAAQVLTDSRTGLYEMQHAPETSFLCGPLALKRIANYSSEHPSSTDANRVALSSVSLQVLDQARSTDHGLSLSQVERIARKAGMHYQMAFRTPGAAMVLPAVAHWKVGHYAAVVDRSDGRYLVEDSTFGEDIHVSPVTLDEEASGYFLIPEGRLPAGWRRVSASEGAKIWGRGDTGQAHDNYATGCNCGTSGYTTPTVEQEVVGLELNDAPIGYAPPIGPAVKFNLVYSHRDMLQPGTFSYANFGPKWTFNWISYITDTVKSNASALLYQRGGGAEPFTFSSTAATTAYPGPYTQASLTRAVDSNNNTISLTLTFPDGSFEDFNQANPSITGQFMLTAIGDAAGNTLTLAYDSSMRIVSITDAIGQVSTLSYGLAGSPLIVTQITDPFGRSASFTYNSAGQLASITDVLGITSSYTYGQGNDPDFINTLTTPYGATTFVFGDVNTNSALGSTRFLKTTDPLGRSNYVEFDQGVDAGDTTNGVMNNQNLIPTGMNTCNSYLNYRNTFSFDANQYALASSGPSLNYSLAHVTHWLHDPQGSVTTSTSRIAESEKQPLENRIWYNYPGQPTGSCGSIYSGITSSGTVTNGASNLPSVTGRVVDNGTTQLQTAQYNPQGNLTRYQDPVGRITAYTYAANGIDRLTTANITNGTQLLETRTYNSQHKPVTITAANGKVTRIAYNSDGLPTRITDPLGHVTTYTYDTNGRLTTTQLPLTGATYSSAYDSVGRIAATTDPAGATVRFTYDAADRLTVKTYPDGTTSHYTYNLLDLASSTDRLGHTTHLNYDADREWIKSTDALGNTTQVGYNLAGKVNSLTDANGHATTMTLDAEGRMVSKQFPDGTSFTTAYDSIGLLSLVTDSRGQMTVYTHNSDNTVAAISYSGAQPTPAVSFVYDPAYYRMLSMTDGTGTTTYSYYPVSSSPVLGATHLRSVVSPIAGGSGTDTLIYTYDALGRTLGLQVNGVTQTTGYDNLGRVTSTSNPLDTFTVSYADATSRVTGVSSTQGPAFALSYFGPQGDELLQQTSASTQEGASLAQYGYTYNAADRVTSLSATVPTAQTTAYNYDAINRLTSGTIGGASTPQFAYGYDPASNLTSIETNGSQQSPTYNSVNEVGGGTYDANGSPTSLGTNTYVWDTANRLVSFTNGTTSSTFSYDGLGRMVRVIDSSNGTVVADHSYLWCGPVRCLAHDNTQAGSPVSTQYFSQGVISNGTPYYYVEDALGNVNQLVTAGGVIAAQYAYDPYGNSTLVSGNISTDIGYAGYFHHAASGLDFAVFRAYDPAHARWLNRDPAGEAGGINDYAYANGDPMDLVDFLGLTGICRQGSSYYDCDADAPYPGAGCEQAQTIPGDFIVGWTPCPPPPSADNPCPDSNNWQQAWNDFMNGNSGIPPSSSSDAGPPQWLSSAVGWQGSISAFDGLGCKFDWSITSSGMSNYAGCGVGLSTSPVSANATPKPTYKLPYSSASVGDPTGFGLNVSATVYGQSVSTFVSSSGVNESLGAGPASSNSSVNATVGYRQNCHWGSCWPF